MDEIEDSASLEAIVEAVEKTHSTSPQDDEGNREYLIWRAVFGDNPTQEEMRAVVACGLEQHKINFPHLYQLVNLLQLEPFFSCHLWVKFSSLFQRRIGI